MSRKKVTVRLTKHANSKITQRDIHLDEVREIVLAPELTETDRYDSSLAHFIGEVKGRFLRVIGRWEGEDTLSVISAFYYRRLKKKGRR